MTAKPIPRLSGLPVLGNLLEFKNDRLSLYRKIQERFGAMGAYTLFSKPFAVTGNAELTRSLLLEHHADFERSPVMLMMKPILGEGLLTTDNASNNRQRQWIMPAFQSDRHPDYARLIVTQTRQLCDGWREGQQLDLSVAMQQLTLGIISQALFSIDVRQEYPDFAHAVTALLHYTDERLKLMLPVPLSWPLPINRRLQAAMRPLNAFLESLIERRRNTRHPHSATSPDLLDMLLQACDEETGQPLSNRMIRDQVLTFLFAGHETTANTLLWTIFLLARNPETYDRLQAEIVDTLQDRPPIYEDLKRLPYTQQVVKEALRLYPPAYAFGRTTLRSLQLGDYQVPKGMVILTAPYIMHRNPDYFPVPEQFDPDRFAPESESRIPRFAYLPFGAGPRACIGRQFAMMEAQLILATLTQQFRFSLLNPSDTITPEPMVTLRPSQRLQVRLMRISQTIQNTSIAPVTTGNPTN
jgi:cytochrome P450